MKKTTKTATRKQQEPQFAKDGTWLSTVNGEPRKFHKTLDAAKQHAMQNGEADLTITQAIAFAKSNKLVDNQGEPLELYREIIDDDPDCDQHEDTFDGMCFTTLTEEDVDFEISNLEECPSCSANLSWPEEATDEDYARCMHCGKNLREMVIADLIKDGHNVYRIQRNDRFAMKTGQLLTDAAHHIDTLTSLLQEAIELMPLGMKKRADWFTRASKMTRSTR